MIRPPLADLKAATFEDRTLGSRFLERQALSPSVYFPCGRGGRPIACHFATFFAVKSTPGSLLDDVRSSRTGRKREISRPCEITPLATSNSKSVGASVSAVVEIGCVHTLGLGGRCFRSIENFREVCVFRCVGSMLRVASISFPLEPFESSQPLTTLHGTLRGVSVGVFGFLTSLDFFPSSVAARCQLSRLPRI